MNNDAIIIICSRLKSSRIPEKAFLEIAGVSAIEHILCRIKSCGIKIVIATPFLDVNVFRARIPQRNLEIIEGNALSPLHRLYDVACKRNKPQYIIRITNDDILIDSKTLLDMLNQCRKNPQIKYAYSPDIVEGAGVEIIRFDVLEKACKERIQPTEFVSYFVKKEPMIKFKPRHSICRDYRLTLDYSADAQLLEIVLRKLGWNASNDEICHFLDTHSYLLNINKLPKYSFYTCNYNSEKYIEQTILSVLNLDLPDIEYIVIDDYSTDNSLLKISKYYKNLKLIMNESNKGLAFSSNIALDNCKGQYVMRIDSDDVLLTHHFANALPIMTNQLNEDKCIIYPAFHYWHQRNNRVSKTISPKLYHHAGCALMDKKKINEFRFKDGLKYWDGLELYNRLKKNKCEMGYYLNPTWLYRKHSKSLSNTNLKERQKVKSNLGL